MSEQVKQEEVKVEEKVAEYDIDTLFTDAFEHNKSNPYISVILWGPEEVGKTYTALTFPGPIHYLDFDGGIAENLKYFKNADGTAKKEIRRIRCVSMQDDSENLVDPESYDGFKVDPYHTLRNLDIALSTLQSKKGGTVVVDTMSHVNEWLKNLMESRIPKDVKDGKEYRNQFDWKYVNNKWLWIWEKLKNIDANLVVIARSKPVYQGREITSEVEPDLRPNTGYQTSIRIAMNKDIVVKDGKTVVSRVATFDKFRGNKFAHSYSEKDITYDRIMEILKEEDHA